MTEYIDRSIVISRFSFYKGDRIPEKDIDGFPNTIAFRDVKSIIRSIPAADVAPVVHGKWIKRVNPNWKAHSHDACSICGWWNTRNALCYDRNRKPGCSLNYCPNCGAKMDLEE